MGLTAAESGLQLDDGHAHCQTGQPPQYVDNQLHQPDRQERL